MMYEARTRSILRCLYASLGLSIPIYILNIITSGSISFWLSSLGLVFSIAFATVLPSLTFKERALQATQPASALQKLPPLTRLPTIICCFLIAIFWMGSLGICIFQLLLSGYTASEFSGSIATGLLGYQIILAVGIPQALLVLGQIPLTIATAILCAMERSTVKRRFRTGQTQQYVPQAAQVGQMQQYAQPVAQVPNQMPYYPQPTPTPSFQVTPSNQFQQLPVNYAAPVGQVNQPGTNYNYAQAPNQFVPNQPYVQPYVPNQPVSQYPQV